MSGRRRGCGLRLLALLAGPLSRAHVAGARPHAGAARELGSTRSAVCGSGLGHAR